MSTEPIVPRKVADAEHSLSAPPFDWRDFQPEMLQGNTTLSLELTTYRDHLDALLEDAGKYVVIKGREIIGIYADFDTAVESSSRFAPEPVFVKQILETEPLRSVSHVLC
jgi:hypothetical protein